MKVRSSENEKLDDLKLHGKPLYKALQKLEWVNRWFGNHWSVIKTIHTIIKKEERPLRIIDLGCGGLALAVAVIDFLKTNLSSISTALIFIELKRNRSAMRLFKFSSFFLPISKLAKEDGLLAIKRSFSEKEWLAILQQAGIETFSLQRVLLFRILLTINPVPKI